MTEAKGRVAVIGAGTMGHGIAQVAASAGYATTLYDVSEDAVQAGLDKIRANLDKGVALGKVDEAVRDASLANLASATELTAAVVEADIVVEAVPEVMDLKINLFNTIAGACSPNTLLATNTSSLSVSEIGNALPSPDRFVGIHFFNPVHIMKLVEVVHGEQTSDDAVQRALEFSSALGKDPIVVKDSPGFASSRLGIILGLEAIRMVEEGVASAEDIDKAMVLGYRHPMGPLRLTDLVGLDVRLGIAEYLHRTLASEAFRPPELLRSKVAAGQLGKKSGQGFYDWSESA